MSVKSIALCAVLIASCAALARAQQTASGPIVEQPVSLTARPIALDAQGRDALSARLLTTSIQGSADSPVSNIRLTVENVSPFFYEYVAGRVTFYDAQNVRCGEGLFKFDVLAPHETAETDTPGLRLHCSPSTWRIVATNLLTRSSDTAKPNEPTPAPGETMQPSSNVGAEQPSSSPLQFVNLNIDGVVYRVPLGSTVSVPVSRRKININVSAAAP